LIILLKFYNISFDTDDENNENNDNNSIISNISALMRTPEAMNISNFELYLELLTKRCGLDFIKIYNIMKEKKEM
jgi:hypothetical protein